MQDTIGHMNCLVFQQSDLPLLRKKLKEYEETYCHEPKEKVQFVFSSFKDDEQAYQLICLRNVAPFHFANLCWFLEADFGLYENKDRERFLFSPSTEEDVLLGQRSDGLPLELFVPTTGICETKRNAAVVPSYQAGRDLVDKLSLLSPQEEFTFEVSLEQPICHESFGNESFSVNCERDESWQTVVLAEEESAFWDSKRLLQLVAAVACGLAVSEMIYLLVRH